MLEWSERVFWCCHINLYDQKVKGIIQSADESCVDFVQSEKPQSSLTRTNVDDTQKCERLSDKCDVLQQEIKLLKKDDTETETKTILLAGILQWSLEG